MKKEFRLQYNSRWRTWWCYYYLIDNIRKVKNSMMIEWSTLALMKDSLRVLFIHIENKVLK